MEMMVKISCAEHGPFAHEVEAIKVERGLAITPALKMDCTFNDGRHVVTHVSSGLRLGHWWLSKGQVAAWFKELLATDVDWTRDVAELVDLQPYAYELRSKVLRETS
jgi:hypothetical protein